jgi:hypothetical protein
MTAGSYSAKGVAVQIGTWVSARVTGKAGKFCEYFCPHAGYKSVLKRACEIFARRIFSAKNGQRNRSRCRR